MKKTIYAVLTAIVTLVVLAGQPVYADRHDQEEYEMAEILELMMDFRKSQVLDVPKHVKVKEVPKISVITIDEEGSHLPLTQSILFIGPVNDDYFVIPFDNGSGAKPHKWLSGVYKAKYFGQLAEMKAFTLQVKVKDPAQHDNIFGTPHEYVMIFEEEDENGPKEVDFSSPNHSGLGGSHGGGAHGNR